MSPPRLKIPAQGLPHAQLLQELDRFAERDTDYRAGRTFSLVYYLGEAHAELLKAAHNRFFSENALNPAAFQSLRRMEAQVVQMSASMLNGPPQAVGTLTSGGTESLLMAVKAYRDRARRLKPWILRPEIVAPRTLHVAFEKAGHYFGVKMRYAPVDADGRADVRAMARLVGRNTIALAASAPQYPHGVVDPIEQIGALAEKKKLPFHVDACFGGFILPWVERAGYPVPVWDFRVPGVTSVSADLHKYGYAAKGASVIIYREMSYLRHQFFVATDWPGGIYISPSMPGTRPGGPIAAAWAALMAVGEAGYIEHARDAMAAAAQLRAGIEQIEGLAPVVSVAHAPVVAWYSVDAQVDIFAVADQLEAKGWGVDRQQFPNCIHCTVNANQLPVIPEYLADVREAVAHVRAHPQAKSEGNAALYGMMAKVPVRGLVRSGVLKVMEQMYAPEATGMPALDEVGQGEDDDRLLRLMNRYGDRALEVLDQVQALGKKLRGGR